LDDFAGRYGGGALPGPGSTSHEAAIGHAKGEYDIYLKRLAEEPSPAELDYLETLKAAKKQIEETGGG
jgi:hypothetical protein